MSKRDDGTLTIPIQLPDSDRLVVIELPGRIPESDWDYFTNLLNAMKRSFIERPAPSAAESSSRPRSTTDTLPPETPNDNKNPTHQR